MPTQPFAIETFGGLNVRDDPFEIGANAAASMVDVDLDARGRVRTRDGATRVVSITKVATEFEGMTVFDQIGMSDQVLVGYDKAGTGTLDAYTSAGALVASTTTSFDLPWSSAARGASGGAQYLYLADGLGAIRRWDGSAFSTPAGMPASAYLAGVPTSGRLAGAPNGSSVSQIVFSDPFDAETWDPTNFVELAPGDGTITALASWQDKLFVFKQRQFFVFTGESQDADGGAIFNYYAVDRHGGYKAIAGDEGVYFWDGRVIWLTTGGAPSPVSSTPVEPILRGETSINGETVAPATAVTHRLSYAAGRLYVSMLMTGGARRTLVFDPRLNTWMYWTPSVCCAGVLGGLNGQPQTFWLSTAGVEKFAGATTDNGDAISWSYTSGRYALADAGHPAVTQESSLFGSGTVTLALDTDLYATQSGSATLGTAPAIAEGWPLGDQEGTWFQHTLSGTGPASVSRLTHYVRSVRSASVR